MRRISQERAAAVAAAYGGAAPLAALTRVGISDDAAERAVAAGAWQRLARGWYVPHAGPLAPLTLARAAVARVPGPCVVTGLVVLHEFGLRWLPPVAEAHLLVPDEVRRTSSGRVRITRCAEWESLETWRRAGLRLTMTDRAIVDAARHTSSLRDVRGIVLGAVADGCVTPEQLGALLDAGQRNGSGRTRRAMLDAARGCASPPEAELVDGLIGLGQRFLVNPELWLGDVLLGSPDIWLLDRNVGGEVESDERHGKPDDVQSTYDRHERFAAATVELVHLSVGRIRRGQRAAARHLLQRAAERRAPAPRGLRIVPRGPVLR